MKGFFSICIEGELPVLRDLFKTRIPCQEGRREEPTFIIERGLPNHPEPTMEAG